MRCRIVNVSIACLLTLPGLLSPACAEDLLRLVHRDAAACLHVPQPVADWDRIRSSEFATRIADSPVFQEWQNSPEFEGLKGLQAVVEATLGKPLPQAAEELFGRGFVFVAYVTPGGEPNGLLLLETDTGQTGNELLAKFRQFTDPKTEQKTHRDFVYEHWVGKDGKSLFFTRPGNVLALSETEEPIRRVIDLHLETSSDASLSGRDELVTSLQRRSEHEVAALYIAPRAWDSHITADGDTPQALKNAWKRCHWITMRMRYDDAPTFDVEADYDGTDAPEWWTRWVDLANARRLPVERIPDNALVAMSGLLDSPGLSTVVRETQPDEDDLPKELRQTRRMLQGLLLGLDPVNDLLPVLGPRWMAYVVPRQLNEAGALSKSFPADMLFAIQLHDRERAGDDDPDPTEAIHNTLVTGLNVLTAVHNTRTSQQVATVRQKSVKDITIRWAEPVALFRPAYAIADGYLLIASSPDLCEQFIADRSRDASPVADLADQLQFLVASSATARQLLSSHEDWFLWRASKDGVAEDEAARRLEQLDGVLQMLDRVWLSTALDADLIRLSAGISVESRGE